MSVKQAVLAALTSRAVAPLWRPFVNDCVVLLMLHRFSDDERGGHGVSVAGVRECLQFLRRSKIPVASLHDLLSANGAPGRGSSPSVVFTVDDGYADFARLAAPVFAEFDCPVTVFLTTAPIDRAAWLWWDRVEYVVASTARSRVELEVGGVPMNWRWASATERIVAAESISESLKVIPDAQKEAVLVELATRLEVDVPAQPTSSYAAMTWSDVRRCGERGATFGPHTVTHPMLPQVSDAEAEREILESWRVLRANCTATVPVFCYPNGAYTEREVSILARSDLAAALTTKPRYAARSLFGAAAGHERFRISRFAYTENRPRLRAMLTGFERVNMAIQDGRDGWRTIDTGPMAATT